MTSCYNVVPPQLSGEKLKIWVTYKTSTVAGELTMPQKHHISKWNPGLDEIGNELPVTQVGWEESLNTKCHFRVMYVFFSPLWVTKRGNPYGLRVT